ncbi:MAG: GGDEF domain-containing protein [Geobacteraceae bacterium]|nr:GGDEF domain-containing protein [Geobacteraceae bacterium]
MKFKLSKRTTKVELIRELKTLQLKLQEYRLLLDESSDPIFAFYRDGRYRYVNKAFADGVGHDRTYIIGRTIWDIFSRDEADRRFAAVKWVFENGQTRIIEVRVPRSDGDRYYVTTVKPIFDIDGAVDSVICISKDITDRKLIEEKLAHMAQYDSLTNLPNRALFSDRLQHAISEAVRNRTRLALLFIDLDNFKTVNDTCGHSVGDILLQEAAQRLQACVRKSDTVGRIGGDEFVILLPGIEDDAYALAVAEKIRQSLSQPFDPQECQYRMISASIGVAVYPDHGSSEIELIRNADDALYRAKESGRNGVRLYQPAKAHGQ